MKKLSQLEDWMKQYNKSMEKLAKIENRFIHASTIIVNLIINKLEEGKNYVMVSKQEVVNYTDKIVSYVLEKSNINLTVLWMYWDDSPYGDDLNAYESLDAPISFYAKTITNRMKRGVPKAFHCGLKCGIIHR